MKRMLALLSAALLLIPAAGCGDSGSSHHEMFSLESVTETAEMTAETTTTAATETEAAASETSSTAVTSAITQPETTAAPPEKQTFIGKWVLDSTVKDGKVSYRDTALNPPMSYRQIEQVEFFENGKFERIHPLYGYTEYGTWDTVPEDIRIVRVSLPADLFFNPSGDSVDFYFEHGSLFIKAPPAGTDYYFDRVTSFPAPPAERAAAGAARMSLSGYWQGAWVTADNEQYTDEFNGVKIQSMRFKIEPAGDCCYYENDDPKTETAYNMNNLTNGTMELFLLRSPNPYSTVGQSEGTLSLKNGYLIWRYNDATVISFRSVGQSEFQKALYPTS